MRHSKLILLPVLLTAIYFNFNGIKERGFINWDEPYYLTYAQFGVSAVKNVSFLYDAFRQSSLDIATIENRLEGRPLETAKPGHVALLSIFGLLTGGLQDYSGSILSAIFGVGTVLLVFLVGRRFFDEAVGLVSAAMLAVSPYFLMYSRSAMPETDAAFFFLLALFIYNEARTNDSRRWILYLAGLTLGFAFSVNYRWLFLCPMFFLFEIKPYLEARQAGQSIRAFDRITVLAAGILTFPVLFELPYLVVGLFKPLPFPSYWAMLFSKYFTNPNTLGGPMIYPHTLFVRLLWTLLGPLGLLSLTGGVVLLLNRRKVPDLLILIPFLIPFLAFSLKTRGDKAVALSIAIPFIALIVGNALCFLARRIPRSKRVWQTCAVACLTLLVAIPQAWTSNDLIRIRSGYRSALQWLLQNRGETHYSTAVSISNFYVGGREKVVPLPDKFDEIQDLEKSGRRYLLIDWRGKGDNPVQELVKENLEPVFSHENDLSRFWPYIVDDFHFRHDRPGFVEQIATQALDKVMIFDLADLEPHMAPDYVHSAR